MSVKSVVGILLLVSIMLAGTGTAQASKVVLMDAKDTGTAQAYAFDIDDIDSPNIQSAYATSTHQIEANIDRKYVIE